MIRGSSRGHMVKKNWIWALNPHADCGSPVGPSKGSGSVFLPTPAAQVEAALLRVQSGAPPDLLYFETWKYRALWSAFVLLYKFSEAPPDPLHGAEREEGRNRGKGK